MQVKLLSSLLTLALWHHLHLLLLDHCPGSLVACP